VAAVVTGDRTTPGHMPGDVIGEQAAQGRRVVVAGVEPTLGLVEGLGQPRVRVHATVPRPEHRRRRGTDGSDRPPVVAGRHLALPDHTVRLLEATVEQAPPEDDQAAAGRGS